MPFFHPLNHGLWLYPMCPNICDWNKKHLFNRLFNFQRQILAWVAKIPWTRINFLDKLPFMCVWTVKKLLWNDRNRGSTKFEHHLKRYVYSLWEILFFKTSLSSKSGDSYKDEGISMYCSEKDLNAHFEFCLSYRHYEGVELWDLIYY